MRSRSILFVVVLVLVLLGSLAGVVYAYDQAHRDQIAKGVSVGGVDVGGLTGAEARSRLQRELLDPLERPIVVRHGKQRWRLRAAEARIAANLDATIEQALSRSRDGNPIQRAWCGLTGQTVSARLEPEVTYSDRAVTRLLARVRAGVDRPAKDATVKISGAGVQEVDGQTGLAARTRVLRRRIRAAITDPSARRRFVVRTKTTQPAVTRADLTEKYETVVVVNRGAFKLTLYKRLKTVKTYPIAVGQIGLETPAGLYAVQNKAVNPAWHVPNSAWAGDLAGKVISGSDPTNPIKARWLGIYDGVGIHGTSDDASIGSAASHGCIRMHIPDVEDLYERVPVGASVYIA
jgi:lipoprotein-anchoring transpeptidase ErfK/SrfK